MIATFANGDSIESDFLIGADGIHSRVRSQFLNDNDPIFRGYTVWRGISPTIPNAIPSQRRDRASRTRQAIRSRSSR